YGEVAAVVEEAIARFEILWNRWKKLIRLPQVRLFSPVALTPSRAQGVINVVEDLEGHALRIPSFQLELHSVVIGKSRLLIFVDVAQVLLIVEAPRGIGE